LLIEFKVSKKTTTGKERTNKQQRKPLAESKQATKETTGREQTRDNQPNEFMSSHIIPVESEVTGGLAAWGRHLLGFLYNSPHKFVGDGQLLRVRKWL
jgi:hypothetical protein